MATKALFIHHSGLIGGAGVSLVNNLKLLSNDYETTVCLPDEPGDMLAFVREECPSAKLIVYGRRIGAITYYSGGDSLASLRFWYRLALIFKQKNYWNRLIEKENPDVVLCNSTILCWFSALKSVGKRKSICFIRETKMGRRGSIPNRMIHRFLERFSKVLFISDYDKKVENLTRTESNVVYNYVDERALDAATSRAQAEERLGLRSGIFRALYVGGVSEMKGFDLAAAAVEASGVPMELIVAGTTYQDAARVRSSLARKYAAAAFKRFGASEKIRLVGKQKNMSDCYAACDVLLFPMRSPHQARPIFEAGFFHKPVIVSSFPCVEEFVQEGKNGFLVAPNDPKELTERLERLANRPEEVAAMGERNWELTNKNHREHENGRKIMEIIQRLSEEG